MRRKLGGSVAAHLAFGKLGEQIAQDRVQIDGRSDRAAAVPVEVACRKDGERLDAEVFEFALACARGEVPEQECGLAATACARDDAELLHRKFCRHRLHVEQREVLDGDCRDFLFRCHPRRFLLVIPAQAGISIQLLNPFPRRRFVISENVLCASLEQDLAALFAGARTHFNHPVRLLDKGGIVVDEHERVPAGLNLLEHFPECFHVALVQPAGGFVEHDEQVVQVPGRKARKSEPLDFAARKGRCRSSAGQVADAEFHDGLDAVEERVEGGLLVCVQAVVEKLVQLGPELAERRFQ